MAPWRNADFFTHSASILILNFSVLVVVVVLCLETSSRGSCDARARTPLDNTGHHGMYMCASASVRERSIRARRRLHVSPPTARENNNPLIRYMEELATFSSILLAQADGRCNSKKIQSDGH